MIAKSKKQELLSNINNKEERMRLANVIDKYNRCEKLSKITYTSFLNISERKNAVSILNNIKGKYVLYFPNEYSERVVIFFLPEYTDDVEYGKYISCIKIQSSSNKLKHKDYMGAIYSMGISEDVIGDIFVNGNIAYVYVLKDAEDYILTNLFKVGREEVRCSTIELNSNEEKNLKVEYDKKMYIVPSRRVDAILSEVYNLSRKETKEKIVAEDLVINSKVCINGATNIYEGDIVAFRRCGKFKVGEDIRITKSGNICLNIYKYK